MATERGRVIAHCTILPDKLRDFIAAAHATLVEPSRRDSGCVAYDLCQDTADPTRFALIEEWESLALLQAHLARPALQQAVGALRPMGAGTIEVHHYRAVTPKD